jgi:hypothetical protein
MIAAADASQMRQPTVFGGERSHRLEPGEGTAAIDDQHRRAAPDTVDERAEVVLRSARDVR